MSIILRKLTTGNLIGNLIKMLKLIKIQILFSLLIFISAYSQTEQFNPDSSARINFWKISEKTSLYVAASFFYTNPEDSIVVSHRFSDSDDSGSLYCMIPGFTDSALYLFTNKQNGSRVNITKALEKPIPAGTEIFFMYRHNNDIKNKRFTGQNRPGIDPADQTVYPGASFVSREYGLKPGYGHRWAVAGRMLDIAGANTDTIIFGFEDGSTNPIPLKDSLVAADFDFNDVIFQVTGLNLNIEVYPDSLEIVSKDTAYAGDSVNCRVVVWADSAGTKIKTSRFDSLLSWKLVGKTINRDTLICRKGESNAVFIPRTAFKQFSVCASLIDPLSGDTLKISKPVYVLPGKPKKLSIELIKDTTSISFLWNSPVDITVVQIPSSELTKSVYAILRDQFGNFTGFSQKTIWDTSSNPVIPSLLPSVVSVRNGNINFGEGVISKIKSGNMLVCASGIISSSDTLRDTIRVNIAPPSYDSLRITGTTGNVYRSITMNTDSCLIMFAEGRRVDNHNWERISVNWSSDKWSFDKEKSSVQPNFKFCPGDTGTGYIKIEYLVYLTTQLPLTVKPGAPVKMDMFTYQNTPFGRDTSVAAGAALEIRSRVFDKNGIMLAISKPDSVKWSMIESIIVDSSNTSGYFSKTTGQNTKLYPLRARRLVTVICRYGILVDSLDVTITPGKPYRVVIEAQADWHKSMYTPDEIDTIEIPDNRTSATVYAFLRDSLGNYVDSLREGTWGKADTIVKIGPGQNICTGIITKNLQVETGTCPVFIIYGNLKDTAFVKLLPYHYKALKITTVDSIHIDSLVISTNDDTTLHVMALRSDTSIWKDVSADWSISGSLNMSNPGPYFAPGFSISPVKPGTGHLITKLNGTSSLCDSIFVRFTRGSPVRAEFEIITKTEKLIAGDTIKAILRIYNRDGLVPGTYFYNKDSSSGMSFFVDTIGFSTGPFRSVVIANKRSSFVNTFPSDTSRLPLAFENGIDTVNFLLFKAPFSSDSSHFLTAHLGTITVSASPFHLKPSGLNSIAIFHTHPCCPDSLTMKFPDDRVLLYSLGFDKFGNMRGAESCLWNATGTLHKIDIRDSISRIVYTADSGVVHDDENGTIVAKSYTNPKFSDTLRVRIIGPLSVPVSAVTKDMNGNGLIDQIRIKFNMPVFKNSKSLISAFNVKYMDLSFYIDSLKIYSDSTTLDLFLKETDSSRLQTNWQPRISIDNSDFALGGAVESFVIETTDGIGPVISSVKKEIKSNDHKKDLVTVTFSEYVYGPDGNLVSSFEIPEHLFATWNYVSPGKFEKIDALSGIDNFSSLFSPNQLYFVTSNGIELTNRNYFNIRTDSTAYIIKDKAGNTPSTKNRKVRVDVTGNAEEKLVIVPNPSRPTTKREHAGEFHVNCNPLAIDWVKADNSGIAIIFPIVPPDQNTTIGGQITIYDGVGNVVVTDPKSVYELENLFNDKGVLQNYAKWNIFPTSWKSDGSIYNYTIYWNGYTNSGIKAAPGVYKAVLKLYTGPKGNEKVKMYTGLIGICR
jgi:hypothetical protein